KGGTAFSDRRYTCCGIFKKEREKRNRGKSEESDWCEAPGIICGTYRYRHETSDWETADVRLE
ncbi:hypothetical protein, partial [uncultured Dialister sp.]|uniref:hypothetical protein n=1 Tax=uncultured Dialister sp. TaxID=278064 RepID=UPI0025FD5436